MATVGTDTDMSHVRAVTARRRLVGSLVAISLADIATTAVALALGAGEMSPGGALLLAGLGLAGLVVLKVLAVTLVWLLDRGWPAVGRGVGWGLVAVTSAAVGWNALALSAAMIHP